MIFINIHRIFFAINIKVLPEYLEYPFQHDQYYENMINNYHVATLYSKIVSLRPCFQGVFYPNQKTKQIL